MKRDQEREFIRRGETKGIKEREEAVGLNVKSMEKKEKRSEKKRKREKKKGIIIFNI